MKNLIITVLLVITTVFSSNGQASVTSKTHTVSYTVNTILELDFTTAVQNLGFTFSTASDFEDGKTNLSAAGFRVRSNKAWTVNVRAENPNFTASAGGETNVPANKLTVRKTGTTNAIILSTTSQALATGIKGGFGLNTFSVDYIANPGYIAPATYTLGVIYTVTAP